ncbi:hypothetical protein TELCIR_02143 [Teladorsagia circumcincta]|uniref:Uncharacterized protein n=1 Tax=Teladorsagia circumcincta TaxID=45464 RepID=A0A2G9UZY7_TELCI|nr:hypothetical protein TELCIR_02143 [Teladorsagia circumcincta]
MLKASMLSRSEAQTGAICSIGEKMIFTGDRKREEQTAIYISSPIGCQNATGNLTFTYWAYNSAHVEIVLFEDLPDRGYKMLYEKPYVDCGEKQTSEGEFIIDGSLFTAVLSHNDHVAAQDS